MEKNLTEKIYQSAKNDWKNFAEMCTKICEIMSDNTEISQDELENALILPTNY